MLLFHGTYHLFPRRVAFRNYYCMACDAPRRVVQIRTLDPLHLNFAPLIPLGLWKRWTYCECGLCPHQFHLTWGLLKTAAFVVLLVCAAFFWVICGLIASAAPEDAPLYGLVGAVCVLGAIAMGSHLATWRPAEPRYKDRLRAVPPADDAICPFCDAPMTDEFFECHCSRCGVRRL